MVGKRSPVTDFPQNEQGLVDAFIGSAYDIVLGVYNALPLLENIGPQLELVTQAAEDILESVDAAAQSAVAAAASVAAIGNSVEEAEAYKDAAQQAALDAQNITNSASITLQGYVSSAAGSANAAASSAASAYLNNLQAQQARDEAVEIAGFDPSLYVTKVQARKISMLAALMYGENDG